MFLTLLWTIFTLITGISEDYSLIRKDYYDDYSITISWYGWVRQFSKQVNISCLDRHGRSYLLVKKYDGDDIILYPTTWPCDRTAKLIASDGAGEHPAKSLDIRRRINARRVYTTDEKETIKLEWKYDTESFENRIPLSFIVSTTIIVNQKNVTLPNRETTAKYTRIPKRIRPGKYVFQIKTATDEDNEKFLAPTTYEHITEISGADHQLKAEFDDPVLHVTWNEKFFVESRTFLWQCYSRNGTAVEDGSLELEESMREVSHFLSPNCYNATIILMWNTTEDFTDDNSQFYRDKAIYTQSVTTGMLRRKISVQNLTIDIYGNKAVLEWQVEGEEHFPERSYVVRRKDSNCGLPDIVTSDKKIEWSFTNWPKTYQIEVEPKVAAIDVQRSIPTSGEITLNTPELKFGLRAQFDDPFLRLSWHEQNASDTVRIHWQCYDSDGKVEENSEDTEKMSLDASLSPACYNVSATLYMNRTVLFGEHGEGGKAELTYSESVVVDLLKRKISVYNLASKIDGEKVVLKWNANGETYFPERRFLIRRIRFSKGTITSLPDIESLVESAEWSIIKRPETYQIKVEPIVAPHDVQRAIRTSAETTVSVSEALPVDSPTNVQVNAGNPNQVFVDFQPLQLSQIPGEDAGCLVHVCDHPDLSATCDIKSVRPRVGTATYSFLQHSRTYYTTVACGTNAGWGPHSPWIEFQTGSAGQGLVTTIKSSPSSETLSKSATTTQTATTAVNECTVRLSLDATYGVNTMVHWRFRMSDGSAFSTDYLDDVKLILHRRDPTSPMVESFMVTEDANINSIDLGLSPKYKFDLNCYSFELKATIKGGVHISESTRETCFTIMSPSFVMIYIFIIVIVVSIAVAISYKYRHQQVERNEDLKEESKTSTGGDKRKTEKAENKEKKENMESKK